MEFIVQEDWQSFNTSFYLRIDKGDRKTIIGQKDGMLCEFTIDPTSITPPEIKPLLIFNNQMAKDFIKSVVDYASKNGVVTENENLLKGKLLATEKHLEDMRKAFDKLLQS